MPIPQHTLDLINLVDTLEDHGFTLAPLAFATASL